jgi:DTW domain-containing protein YfiP
MNTISIIVSCLATALPHVEANTNSVVTVMIHDVTVIRDDVTGMIIVAMVIIDHVMSGAMSGIQLYSYLRACR